MTRLMAVLFIFFSAATAWLFAETAFVQSRFGELEGRVIVRVFDDIVVTVATPDNRLFQFYGEDVSSVTAVTPILAARAVFLRDEPSDASPPTVAFATGCQVAFGDEEPQGDWVNVIHWSGDEGWIPYSALTDSVDFSFAQPVETLYRESDDSISQPTGAEDAEPDYD